MVKETNRNATLSGQSHSDFWLRIVTYAGAAVLLILSLYYYKLRDGFGDTPYDIVKMIHNNGFVIENNRFAAALNQWMPVLLLKAGAPLKAVAVAYSFCYVLTPMVMALLAIHWLRQTYTAIAILLLFTLMNSLLFYYPVSELQMGLATLLFYNGIIDYCAKERNRRAAFIAATILCVPTIAFCHPMAAPAFAGWLLYRLGRKDAKWSLTGIAVFCFAMAYIIKTLYFVSHYEAEAGKNLTLGRVGSFGLNYYAGPFSISFYKYLLDDAFLVPLILLCSIALLIYQRRWLLLLTGLMAILLAYTVILLAFEDFTGGRTYEYYFEHYMQAPVVMLILVFIQALEKLRMNVLIKAIAVGLILIVSFAKIISNSASHLARQRWEYAYLELMERLHIRKAALSLKWVSPGIPRSDIWAIAPETLLLSALENPSASKTLFVVEQLNASKEALQKTDEWLIGNWSIKQQELPERYFILGDKPYLLLDSNVADSELEHMLWR
jgi:hypothetical protein